MTPDQLRALAEALDNECVLRLLAGGKNHEEAQACEQAADYLRQCAEAEPVARICTDAEMRHRDGRWGRVKWIEAESELPEGALLYTHPAPAAPQAEPQREPCIGNDPACPCQDGDPCHYRDTATTKAWPIPQAKQERKQLSDKEMRSVLIAEARRIAVQAGETDPDSLTVNEEMLAQVMLEGRAVERAHGIGGSDAE